MRVWIILAMLAGTASAHPLEMGYLKLDAHDRTVSLQLELDVDVAAKLGDASPDQLADATYRAQPLAGCKWTGAATAVKRRTLTLTDRATCDGGTLALHWPLPFVERVSDRFQLLVEAKGFGGERVVIVDRMTPALDLAADAPAVQIRDFVWKGVEHIGVAPAEWRDGDRLKLPDGIDHILFLLGLLLGGGSLLRLTGVTTGFTLGHTITLGLATFGILRPPGWLIEPLIALTIAFVAIEVLTGKFEKHRWKIAAGFGLIHGFGFADALTKLDLSRGDMVKALFGYNVGVELGQLAIVLLIAPLVLLGYQRHWFRTYAVKVIGCAIFIAAMYWFFQRL